MTDIEAVQFATKLEKAGPDAAGFEGWMNDEGEPKILRLHTVPADL